MYYSLVLTKFQDIIKRRVEDVRDDVHFMMLDPRSMMQDSGYWIQDSRCRVQDARYRIHDLGTKWRFSTAWVNFIILAPISS